MGSNRKTPCSPGSPAADVKLDEFLLQAMAEECRSLVGIAMYVSQERFDLQYATKTSASSECFALRMKETQMGTTFQENIENV